MLTPIAKTAPLLAAALLAVLLGGCGGSASNPPAPTQAPPQPPPTPTPTTGASGTALFKTLSGHSAAVASVAYSPDGKTIASGGDDKTVKIWQLTTNAVNG